MNKKELILAAAAAAQLDKQDMTRAVEALLGEIAQAMRRGEQVHLTGFGIFETRLRQGYTANNPKTGALMQVEAAKIPVFRPAKGLKDRIQEE